MKLGVVVLSPELAFRHPLATECMWRNRKFTSNLISITWDEVHCVSAWRSFRPDLAEAGRMRSLLPPRTPYLMPSATLPEHTRKEVLDILQARKGHLRIIQRSNDRPNVFITVRRIQHALTSFEDLDFLIPDGWTPETNRQFVVFFDNIEDSVQAARRLRQRLPKEYCERVVWFNSDNTPEYRDITTAEFQEHKLCGLYCTDSFGMVRSTLFD